MNVGRVLVQELVNVVPVDDLSPPETKVRINRMQPAQRPKAHPTNRRSPTPAPALFLNPAD